MSEEEAIKELQKFVSRCDKAGFIEQAKSTPTASAILTLLDLYNKEKQENKEIRQWKYVIDTYEDLDKLKELDLIKIKGKEYISKDKIREFANTLITSKYWGNDEYIHGKNEEREEIGKKLLELLEENKSNENDI